jgi:hypothetical protein
LGVRIFSNNGSATGGSGISDPGPTCDTVEKLPRIWQEREVGRFGSMSGVKDSGGRAEESESPESVAASERGSSVALRRETYARR